MSDELGLEAAPEAQLELRAWGTRFESAMTERDYGAWQIEQAVPFSRAGLWTAFAIWFAVLPVSLGLHIPSVIPVVAIVMLPVLLCAVFTTYRRHLLRWMLPSTSLAISVAGAVCVYMMNIPGFPIECTMAALFINNYFGFAFFRLRPLRALLSVAPGIGLEQVVLSNHFRMGAINGISFGAQTFCLVTAISTGFMISVVLDVVSRRSYRQERIIEAQKETIAHERARSEALLKRELSHQVAERSRELGDVLSRVGAPAAQALPVAGERFHRRYLVTRALGEGGMGAVFEVERLTDKERLALKLVTGQVSSATAARFAREAEIGARVHHRNLVSIVDVGVSEGGAPFLVMELVRGRSLSECRDRFGDVAWSLPILRQIVLGLSALHDAGVVHRDLKPGNVLIEETEGILSAKISDFGISRFGQLDDASHVAADAPTIEAATPKKADLTGTGVILGTPLYMAPEAAHGGRTLLAAADVFAFGVLAYEMLTGRTPFQTPAVLMALAGQPFDQPAPIEDANVDATLRDLLQRCLAEDPKARPSSHRISEVLSGVPASV